MWRSAGPACGGSTQSNAVRIRCRCTARIPRHDAALWADGTYGVTAIAIATSGQRMSSQATVRAVAAILRNRTGGNREGGRSTYREHRSG